MKYGEIKEKTYSVENRREIILPEDWEVKPAGFQRGHQWQNGLPVWEDEVMIFESGSFYVDKIVKEVTGTNANPRCFLIERRFYTYENVR